MNMAKMMDEMEPSMASNKWLKELASCDKIMLDEEVDALGNIANEIVEADENVSGDEVDEDLEAERHRLNHILQLPADTYSLTRIKPSLPDSTKFGVRSGLTHMNMHKFSTFSRGLQGAAIAIAGFATTALLKASCWNESVIDQIIDDGDTWYCESYGYLDIPDRRSLTILDLRNFLTIQKKNVVHLIIDEAAYTGLFRSNKPTEMHLVKALELFFEIYDAAVLTSSVLNISIWREGNYFNIFDAQPRLDDLMPDETRGSVKLMLLRDLEGVLFIILEKSHVGNEHFVLYPLRIKAIVPLNQDDPEEPEKSVGKPERRPSGYNIQENFRAIVRSSFHITHSKVPDVLQGRAHLIVALAALVYSRFINARKWSTPMIDLIFNQAHIYIVDLARILEKKFDESFDLNIDDLFGDIFLGVYSAKVKIEKNVVPGQAKKGKSNIDSGIRDFFKENLCGILEVKKTFYAVWKDDDKYYFLDPFACDNEGFRVNSQDPEENARFLRATGCVTMNSSINEMIETILENTGNAAKDPFFIHGVQVLYVKTDLLSPDSSDGTIIYRNKKTNRRPVEPSPLSTEPPDNCLVEKNIVPKPRSDIENTKEGHSQYPDLMRNVEDFMMMEKELFIQEEEEEEEILNNIESYKIVNPHRLILHASGNCMDSRFDEISRGRQGLSMALTAISFAKLKHPSKWRNVDLNQVIDFGNNVHNEIIEWICRGSPKLKDDDEDVDDDGSEEEEEEEEEGEEEEDSAEENEKDEKEEEDKEESEEDTYVNTKDTKNLRKTPSHIDVSMLPNQLKFDVYNVKFKSKMKIIEGDADPIVNLGEALEQYFKKYDELILENKRLMYAVWKQNEKYFAFNPYGADEEGWRYRGYPACCVVTDTINELVDLFHGIFEFNDREFQIHFVSVESIGPKGKYISPVSIEIPNSEVEKYKTVFLPLTDDDVLALKPEKINEQENENAEKSDNESDEDDEEDEEDNEDEDEDEDDKSEKEENEEDSSIKEVGTIAEEEPEKILVDPLLEIEEQDRLDAPVQLNLFLLTTNVKLEEKICEKAKEALEYERLKYNHPPPYVSPPNRVLAMLLAAKKASKSVPSLVSCFSIDSKLAIKSHPPSDEVSNLPAIEAIESNDLSSKLIKLPPQKYLFSRIPPIGFTPLRAINEKFIHDEELDQQKEEECRKKRINESPKPYYLEEVPEFPDGVRIRPLIIPLGPVIMTPIAKQKIELCMESRKRVCKLPDRDRHDSKLEKIVCYTEDILFNMIFPMPPAEINEDNEIETIMDDEIIVPEKKTSSTSMNNTLLNEQIEIESLPENIGFIESEDNSVGIIEGHMSLENRQNEEEFHFKACYYAAILCILAKTVKSIYEFRGSQLDQLIVLANKIFSRTGLLRFKQVRFFRNLDLLNVKFNVILNQILYADPENCETDILTGTIERYFAKHSTGILVFGNASYAFWFVNGRYYIFDPYSCDKKGHASDAGSACLLEFCEIDDMIKKIEDYSGVDAKKPYRIYSLCITHVELIEENEKRGNKKSQIGSGDEEEGERQEQINEKEKLQDDEIDVYNGGITEVKSEESLIEMSEWVIQKSKQSNFDLTKPGFSPLENFNASVFEVLVVENDITRPILAPFKKLTKDSMSLQDLPRRKPFDRKFNEHSILFEPIDLCIMAWSCIHEPSTWGTRTIKGIYEASQDLTFDSLLAAEDSTVSEMIDGLLTEFDVANYRFQAVFAPLHIGKLFASEGWNLAMSLKKVFQTAIYTGAIILCKKAHIGILKKGMNFYAWWGILRGKNIRIITSDNMEDFLRILIQEIGESEETEFQMRVITISYAKKLDPDCSDIAGLHEEALPSASLPQIHKKTAQPYDLEAIFRPTLPRSKPIFVHGTVSLDHCDIIKEPHVKRCYFVAVLSVMLKRDIIQSPMPSMIDQIIELADDLYREFENPEYHLEHILRNVTVMNRIFELRDVASSLFIFNENYTTGQDDFYTLVKRELKKHFIKHSDGILHFSNCCYGFWYSQSTNAYYYIDPYRCNLKGIRSEQKGNGCLGIFPTICQMVKSMSINRSEKTTGFFIHRLHVESINAVVNPRFQEDPMWIYLDYHWSFSHVSKIKSKPRKSSKRKIKKKESLCKEHLTDNKNLEVSSWNNFVIEIPQLIYSLWGTSGTYDEQFGERVGKNQAAICVAVMAMQNLCHPSKWSAAILDSAVICGDRYFIESLKSSARRGSKYPNSFNLQPCLKVFPHIWKMEFLPKKCGILYDGSGNSSLAFILKLAFEDSPNVLVNCKNLTIAVLKNDDGFYAADPCWIGPPLFIRDRGAIYVLRCRNMSALVYALVKMINTNLRLEFNVTPVIFNFRTEVCLSSSDKKETSIKKTILLNPLRTNPGSTRGKKNTLSGAIVGDEDIHPTYRKNVRHGIEYGEELKNPVPSPIPFIEVLNACDKYPETVDFVPEKFMASTMKQLTKRNLDPELTLSKPLECLPPRKFILNRSEKEFKRQITNLSDEVYKTYKHRFEENIKNRSEEEKEEEKEET